jgi:hypothetical protein
MNKRRYLLGTLLMFVLIVSSCMISFAADKLDISKSEDLLQNKAALSEFIKSSKFYQEADGSFVFEKERVIRSDADTGEKEISKDTIAIFPLDEISKIKIQKDIEVIRRAGGSGSIDMDEWDSSGSIQAHLIVNYNLSEVDGIQYVKLTSVRGTHSRANSGVSVKSQSVRYACQGFYSGGYQTKSATYTPTSSSWSVTAPSSWSAVSTSYNCLMGANYQLTLGRGTSTWSFSVVNNPYDN